MIQFPTRPVRKSPVEGAKKLLKALDKIGGFSLSRFTGFKFFRKRYIVNLTIQGGDLNIEAGSFLVWAKSEMAAVCNNRVRIRYMQLYEEGYKVQLSAVKYLGRQ